MRLPFRATIFGTLMVLCIGGLCLALWKQRTDLARVTRDNARLLEQNERLQRDVTKVPSHAPEPTAAPEPRQEEVAIQPGPRPPVPEPNRLTLAGTTVKAIPDGLVTTLQFHPNKTGPLGVLALVVRLPRNGNERILDLTPVGVTTYTDISGRVTEDGKFGYFQGTPGETPDVQFALSVSGPATADVRGTCGIEAFKLEIQPSGANVYPE